MEGKLWKKKHRDTRCSEILSAWSASEPGWVSLTFMEIPCWNLSAKWTTPFRDTFPGTQVKLGHQSSNQCAGSGPESVLEVDQQNICGERSRERNGSQSIYCVRGAVQQAFWRLNDKMCAGSGQETVLEVDPQNVCGERYKERFGGQSTKCVRGEVQRALCKSINKLC